MPLLLTVFLTAGLAGFQTPSAPVAEAMGHISRQPYTRYLVHDRFGRDVTFFLSEAPSGVTAPLPLVVYVQGSGCGSAFALRDGRITPTFGRITVEEAFAGRARVLVVDKPGVTYLDQPAACTSLAAFYREHTLDRWAVAVESALLAARALPAVDPSTSSSNRSL
jgi:hypothetical protein